MERFEMARQGLIVNNITGPFCFYADAQATIAALQARVQELEGIKIPDDAFTYCAYCGEKSPVDEHNEDLSAHIKVCPKHPMRDVESQLTQRTAELEVARRCKADEHDLWLQACKERDDLQAELERVRGELAEMRERKDGAYLERNRVVAALATCFPSGTARTAIEGWNDAWHGCIYIDLPTGQVSWHYHDSHAHLFAHLPAYTKSWDGHTTDEKYRRVLSFQNNDIARLRTLISALPKVENVSIKHTINEHDYESWHVWVDHSPFAECDTEADAEGLKALLQHRQGME